MFRGFLRNDDQSIQRTFANRQRCLGMQLPVKAKKGLSRFRAHIKRLPPYPALVMLAVPLAVAEPLKLVTVFIAGAGHWIVGLGAMLFAYAVSLFVTHWLFVLVKPQLLTLPWFARTWALFVALRNRFWHWFVKVRPAARPLRKH
jgi:hypothetical protein